jgi:hypothetical protein
VLKTLGLPCQNCGREIAFFGLVIEAQNEIVLRLQCHSCRTTSYYHFSFETLNCLARGEPVQITAQPPYVM